MSAKEVGEGLVALCKQGLFDQAAETYYDENILSVEADGTERETRGMDAIRRKTEWWNSTFDVVGAQVDGPWVNEPFFIVKFVIDVKEKATGKDIHMEELAVYEVSNGKIVSERFF